MGQHAHSRHISLGRWISVLYRKRNIFFDRELKPYGLRAGEDRILFVLYHLIEHGGPREVSQADIARYLNLDKGTVTRSMTKLERKGYVNRERSSHDSREYCIRLTKRAQDVQEALMNIRRKWTRILEAGFTAEDKRTALRLFEEMAENADTYLSRA